MKRIINGMVFLGLLLVITPAFAQDQTQQQQNNITDCLRNYSLYYEYYKQKNYNEALPFWRLVYNNSCMQIMLQQPKYNKVPRVVYQNGASIYKHLIVDALKNKNADLANAYVDTLMMIYNKRMGSYPSDSARVLGYKGIDLLKFKGNDPSALNDAYRLLAKAIKLYKDKTPVPTMAAFMDITISLYKDNIVTGEEVVNNYAKLSDIIEKKLNEEPNNTEVQKLKDNIASLFTSSGAATCESLISLFSPHFEENKNNPEALKKYIYWLKNTDCTDKDLYLQSMIALNKIQPASSLAFDISQILKKRGQYDKAINYLKQAVTLESDGSSKSKFYLDIADITFRIKKDLPKAKDYCEQAIQSDPKSGLPHILLGSIYANAKNYGDNELAHQSVFWAAVDQFTLAKKKDPSLTDMANERIAIYSKHFPSNETVFFFGFKEGSTYVIKGWINETTKVRTRK